MNIQAVAGTTAGLFLSKKLISTVMSSETLTALQGKTDAPQWMLQSARMFVKMYDDPSGKETIVRLFNDFREEHPEGFEKHMVKARALAPLLSLPEISDASELPAVARALAGRITDKHDESAPAHTAIVVCASCGYVGYV